MLGIKNFFSKEAGIGKYSKEGQEAAAKALSDYRAQQQERIFNPKEHEAFLNDLADKRLGVHVSRDVAAKVFELQSKVNALKNIDPKLSGVSDEFLKAQNELQKYVESQNEISIPQSIARNIALIMRNNLLINPATPIKTSVGQTVNTAMEFATRRLGALSLRGANPDLVSQANKEAWETFRTTGHNTAAMESLTDSHVLGKGENFKTPTGTTVGGKAAQGLESAVRTVAKISNKVAIDWEHNIAFTKFHQKAFFDMANISSTGMAKGEGLVGDVAKARAAELFKDAVRIEPETQLGAMVRMEAQRSAARVTSTNETFLARLSLYTKSALNKTIPNFPLGVLLS